MEKNKGCRVRDSSGLKCNFNRRIRECLAEKVTFEQLCGRAKEGSCVGVREECSGRGNS